MGHGGELVREKQPEGHPPVGQNSLNREAVLCRVRVKRTFRSAGKRQQGSCPDSRSQTMASEHNGMCSDGRLLGMIERAYESLFSLRCSSGRAHECFFSLPGGFFILPSPLRGSSAPQFQTRFSLRFCHSEPAGHTRCGCTFFRSLSQVPTWGQSFLWDAALTTTPM